MPGVREHVGDDRLVADPTEAQEVVHLRLDHRRTTREVERVGRPCAASNGWAWVMNALAVYVIWAVARSGILESPQVNT
jgi:hypothetical protein